MRFRLSGDTWQVVPSLVALLVQVDQAWPARHAADGTLASVRHREVSPISDHNPDINGDVRAADIGEVTENDAFQLAEAIRVSKDSRVKYVIHEERMYSYYERHGIPPFTWRPYSGTNGHWSHVHVSVLASSQNNVSSWNIGIEKGEEENMAAMQVIDIQIALNMAEQLGANGKVLVEDDIYGRNTAFALARGFQNFDISEPLAEEAHARLDNLAFI
jgi:hypothetical protein